MVSLRNLMEEKQLDFDQPLLSVRRFTSTGTSPETHEKTRPEPKIPPLPVYKSELKSGPVRNPGTVPFVWEQTPGKPKDEGTTTTQSSKRPPLVPKLPPGRTRKVNQEVPTPIDDSLDKNDRETVEEMASCKSRNDDDDEEDDGEEVYRDANDRFYRSESFFLNCSFSGVSGLDGSEIQPPAAASSMDPHARNFMMDRFLPAAKAMASEALPHTNRKLTIPIEQSSEIKTITNGNRQSRPNVHVQTKHVKEIFMEESEDEDDDYDESGYTSARGCGFLPRFCLKGSFFPLNPVPGMRMQATSVRRIRNSSIKSSKDAVNEKRSSRGQGITRTRLQPEEKSSKSNMQEGKIFSLYSHLQGEGEGESNYADEPSRAVHTNVSPRGFTEKAINSVTDGYDEPHRRSLNSFQALLSDESGSSSPVEKTLYIDSVHKMKSPDSSSNSLDMKGTSAKLTSSELANNKKFDLDNQYPFKPSKQSDSNSREHGNKHEFDSKKLIGTDIHESFDGPARDSPDLRTSEDATNGKKDSKNRNGSHGGYSQSRSSFAPPPPKSPSDSWLKRTLPTSKNASFLQSSLTMRLNPVSTTVSPDPIEESTVKSSDSNRLHLQFSKELLSSIPEV